MPMTKSALSPPSLNLLQSPIPWLRAFFKFSRPHTVAGTSLSVLGLFGMAWTIRHPLGLSPGTFHIWQGVSSLWLTWMACVCTNIYIVGLNQVADVAVDRVDKPHLPVASGEFSLQQAKMLVGIACGGAVLLTMVAHSGYLVATVWLSLAIGTAYSLPPLRLKRFLLLGSLCKLLVRGVIVNVGIFLHASSQLGLQPTIPTRVWILALTVIAFSGAIALLKDLRDSKAVTQGAEGSEASATLKLVWWLLTLCYTSLIVSTLFIPGIHRTFSVITHTVALIYFWYLSSQVQSSQSKDKDDGSALSYHDFYQFVWKLFFLEYLLFPTACLLSQA